ncbi:glycosyltransferase involved in cell wall biosynthesis [Agrobacterium vitis]|nr:glycosyltransferase involved in cell wall biosynthesis [Agrobacterium vitis]MBE1436630.1 glycosyltransferase involved in cell wall biosynthesis [Agrobacterium vitis]
MKVLILAEWLRSLGGCETFITSLCRGLRLAGIDASVFLAADDIHERWHAELGENLTMTPAGKDPLTELRHHVDRLRPDLVHAIPMEQTAIAYAAIGDRPPMVGTEPSDGSERCYWPIYGPDMAKAVTQLVALHCFSLRAVGNMERRFGYRGPSTVTTPVCFFPKDRKLWNRQTPSLRLVGWGRLSVEKGWTSLIESMAVLRQRFGPLELDIWGSGPLQPVLEQLIISCGEGERVHLRGPYADHSTLDIDQYDAAVFPSLFEGLPYAFLEALWGGIPVVMSRISGAPQLVSDPRLCRLVDPCHQSQIIDALAGIYEDYGNMAGFAAARRATVAQHCQPAAAVTSLIDLYRLALSAA